MSGDIADVMGGGFDPTSEEPANHGDFSPMPAGWRSFMIEKAEIRETNDKKGKYIWLQLVVISDEYKGRKVFPKINIVNASEQAVKIGRSELAGLGQALKITALTDCSQFVNQCVDGRVTVKPAKGDYPADNGIGAYEPFGTKVGTDVGTKTPKAAAPKPAPAQAAWEKPKTEAATPPAETVPAKAKGKLPWEK